MDIQIQLTNTDCMPVRAHEWDSGYDCYAAESTVLQPFKPVIVPLGFCVAIPEGYEAQIRGRSGLATKGVTVHLGTIDSEFRGIVCAIVTFISDSPYDAFFINRGDRIAQMVVQKVEKPTLKVVHALGSTERGTGGFGSTGV